LYFTAGQSASVALAVVSLLLAAQSAYAALLLLYAWEESDRQLQNRAPETFEPPRLSFTILLPARHEEAVIQDTIQRVAALNYPTALVEALVVVEAGDAATIAAVESKLRQLGAPNVRLLTFDKPPINKPHGLNVGLARADGEIVTIFDAEDEPHPDILQVVNTVMLREETPVVQCGVQLMNYADTWFSALNVLEYFFWFRSRMHYQAAANMVALGGNTVFLERRLLHDMHGWDEACLTEDADIGVRLCAAGVPIRVLYDDRYVTREETPPTVGQFIRQRTRWNQGFLQVLAKGDWLRLPRWRQKLLALYTLASPLLQAAMMIYIPVSLWSMVALKTPELVAMISTLPLYMLLVQLVVNVVGLFEFAAVHRLRASPLSLAVLIISYVPYQWLLSLASLRAAWRQLRGNNTWEKTTHLGAHRRLQAAAPRVIVALDEERASG
jgi:cellulose synthase/poly-beta-1,6-N-acetylglucosamine synthase-like glycosyltransferase